MFPKLKINQRGDTIVEVMFAVIIVGSLLAGSFVASRNNTKAGLQAQEQTVALKYAEGQIEQIKSYSSNNDINNLPSFNPGGVSFCFDNSGSLVDSNQARFASDCTFGNGIQYSIKATKQADNLFVIEVTWPSIIRGNDKVTLRYKAW